MSNDFQNPEGKPEGKTNPPSKSHKDNTESDLWDLDDDSPSAADPKSPEQAGIPSRRKDESTIKTRTPVERHTDGPLPSKKALDEPTTAKDKETEPTEMAVSPPVPDEQPPTETTDNHSSKSPDSAPASLGFLTKIEKIGITVLAAIFVLTAIFAIIHFNNRIPTKPLVPEKLDLPIEGKRMTLTSIETYWREPVTEGENRDVVQRGVKLIPVVRIGIADSSGAIRVLFRNEEQTAVGDNISRRIESGGTIEIAGTAGFGDLGMHAAYRTGDSDRWTVQILEGPGVDAPVEEFETLLETEISTNVR